MKKTLKNFWLKESRETDRTPDRPSGDPEEHRSGRAFAATWRDDNDGRDHKAAKVLVVEEFDAISPPQPPDPTVIETFSGDIIVTSVTADVTETTDAAANTSTTYQLQVGQSAQGTLGFVGDRDWFAVNLVANQVYSFALTGTGSNNVIDPYLRLMSSNGLSVLEFNDDSLPGNNSVFTYTPTSSGTYYISAGAFGDSETGQYGVSVTAGARPSFDTQMGAGVMDADSAWTATPGTGVSVTYAFRQSAATYTVDGSNISTFTQLTATEIAAVRLALNAWSEVSGISFVEVNPGGYSDNATMLFANYSDANDGAGAFAFFPGSAASTASAGDVWLNTNSIPTASAINFGSFAYSAIMHEIGHAIGLSHPGVYNAAPGVSITYANNAQFTQDTHQYSIMSYFDEANTGSQFFGYAETTMLFDVLSAQAVYGANLTTRSGDTIYGFNSNAGAVYDFGTNTNAAFAIWDGGGADTLDASGYATNQTISLIEGVFSSIGNSSSNIVIALGAVIENAIGGFGNDAITGNAANNSLSGGAGGDVISGGGGSDFLNGGAGGDTLRIGNGHDVATGGLDLDIFGLDFLVGAGLQSSLIADLAIGEAISWTALQTSIVGGVAVSFVGPIVSGNGSSTALNRIDYAVIADTTFLYFGLDNTAGSDFNLSITGVFALAQFGVEQNNASGAVLRVLAQTTTYSLSPATTNVSEGVGTVTFTVTRSGDTPAETIFASTTTSEGSANSGDFTALADQALVFAAGELTKTVTLSISNDTVFETNETFGLVVQRNTSDPDATFLAKSTFTVLDDDPAPTTYSLSPATTNVSEGADTVTFTVTRSSSTLAETIFASTTTAEGFANSGDFTALADQAIAFASGELSKTVTVAISNDTVFESNETFGLVVQRNTTDADATFLAKSTFTILDNDPQPTTYSLSPATTNVSEGAGTVSFTVTRSGGTPAETIFASTTTGEGFGNSSDFSALADQVIAFASGELSKTVTVAITNDAVVESTETFGLVVQRNSTDPDATFLAKSTFTILDNDTSGPDTTAPLLSLTSPADNSVNIGTNANIVLTFNEAVKAGTGNIRIVNLTTGAATVISVVDTNQVTFSGNIVTINPTADLLASNDYEVRIPLAGTIKDIAGNNFATLANPINFTTGTGTVSTTTYALSPATTSVDEGVGTVTFTVTRSGSTPAETVFASTTTAEGFANSGDFTAVADQTLVFAAGELTKTVTVAITNDTLFESNETFGLVVQRNSTDADSTFLAKSTFTIQDNDPQPTTYSLSPATTSFNEGVGMVTFTVTRSGGTPAETIFASTSTAEGFANSGDFTSIADQTLVFAAGELTKAVTLSITNDTVIESNETFGLVVQRNSTDPDATFLAKSTFTIIDNDTPPTTYSISPATTSVDEGVGTVTFTVTRSGGTPAETIFASTTTAEGSANSGDFTALADQTLVFAAGELSKTVTLAITNDTLFENNETFGLVVQRNSTDPDATFLAKSTFTIQDNDPQPTTYALTPVTTSVSEGVGTVTFTVTRSGGTPAETIFASTTTAEGSANSGDFTAIADQTLVFAAGELSKSVTLSISNDTLFENNETFGLVVQRNSTDLDATFLAKSTFTILDNDVAPTTYALSPGTVSVNEGTATQTFTITRSGGSPAETIFASTTTAEGFANSGDFTALADQAIAFAAGELSKTVTVAITNDSVVESNETFGLVVQRNTTDADATFLAKSTFTILDDDTSGPDTTAPLLTTTSPADNSVNIGTNANIILTFNEAVKAGTGNIRIVNLSTGGATVISVVDTNQVIFSGNTVTINPTADLLASNDYEVRIPTAGTIKDVVGNNFATLANPINFTTGTGTGPVTTYALSPATTSVDEGVGTVTFTVTRSGSTPAETIFSSTTNAEGSANSGDFTGIADQTLVFAAGELTKTVTLSITNDSVFENNETFGLVVQRNSTDADATFLAKSTFTIIDNDPQPPPTTYALSPATTNVNEGVGTVTFTVTRSGGTPAETIFASTTTAEGFANSGDFTGIADQTLVFAAGELSKTVTLSITNDSVFENSETFGLVVQRNSTDLDATFLAKSTFTILDDDPQPTTYALTPVTTSVNEGVGTVTFTVTRSGGTPAETIFASTTTAEGSANSGDFTGIADQTLVFAAGELTKTVTLSITNDTVFESNETFGLVVQRNSTDPDATFLAKSTFTVLDDDPAPTTYSLSPATTSVSEGAGTVSFTVTRSSSAIAETIFASTTTAEGFANSGDFTALADQAIAFASGELSKTVTVAISNDTVFESNETFGLVVQRNTTDADATFLAKSTFTILDNDTSGPDTTAPLLSTTSPADNSVNIAINANIVLTFNEAVKAGTGNIRIVNLTTGAATVISVVDTNQVTFSGNTVTINPIADLLANNDYEVRIPNTGTIKDIAGNNFATLANPINFTTGEAGALISASSTSAITGTAGNDVLIGTSGDDTLLGGQGVDRFVWTTTNGSGDGIGVDFVDATAGERLDFNMSLLQTLKLPNGNALSNGDIIQHGVLLGGGRPSVAMDPSHNLTLDWNGDGVIDLMIKFAVAPVSLTYDSANGDFLVG